jgi:SpoIIAA-like
LLRHQLLEDEGMLIVTPEAPLATEDFQELAREVDPYIEKNGKLNALVIEARSFPGWKDFGGLVSHLRFVHDHHRKIKRVAVISDSTVLSIAPHFVGHFVAAQIRQFPEDERQAALDWARGW